MNKWKKIVSLCVVIVFVLNCTRVDSIEAADNMDGYRYEDSVYYKLKDGFVWDIHCHCFSVEHPKMVMEKGQSVFLPGILDYGWDYENDKKRLECQHHHKTTFYSSNPSVCKIKKDGTLKAVGKGQAKIHIVSGGDLTIATIDVTVKSPSIIKSKEYKSLITNINSVYKKYGTKGSITKTNHKTAIKELVEVDKALKKYSDKMEKRFGCDAESINAKLDPYEVYGRGYYISELSAQEVISFDTHYSRLTGWGAAFCNNRLVCGDSWKLEDAFANLSSFLGKINPYNRANKNAFQIQSLKVINGGEKVVVKLKNKVTLDQIMGSYATYQDANIAPLKWSTFLHEALNYKSFPCTMYLCANNGDVQIPGTPYTQALIYRATYTGYYTVNDQTIVFERDGHSDKQLPSGTYKYKMDNTISHYSRTSYESISGEVQID